MKPADGSFKDPFGRIFMDGNTVYRAIYPAGAPSYEAARDAGVFDDLIAAGFLLPHQQVQAPAGFPAAATHCLAHPRLPMISYPWEWPFSLLRDAALLHLEMMERLVPKGFWLRDANAFNVQYDGSAVRFIDTLSIGPRIPDSPWVGYGQFCSHFLAPLAVAAYQDMRTTTALWRNYIDGFPLDLARKLLPGRRRWRPGILMHLGLHSRFQEKAEQLGDRDSTSDRRPRKVSDQGLLALVASLRRTISGIRWQDKSKIWADYGDIRTYDSEDVKEKSRFVTAAMATVRPNLVWDLGANRGEYSKLAAAAGAFVVSIDGDPVCSEFLYREIACGEAPGSILPLTMDLANPSPGLGWDGTERMSLKQRGGADLVLALALIHHLVLTNYVPMEQVAEWLAGLCRHLLIEFVPPADPMVRQLLKNRIEGHLPYDQTVFQNSFEARFEFLDTKTLGNGRILHLCRRKDGEIGQAAR